MREGYLSFDIDEVKRLSESDSPNAEAYGYLYQAVTTQAGTAKGIDDAYMTHIPRRQRRPPGCWNC